MGVFVYVRWSVVAKFCIKVYNMESKEIFAGRFISDPYVASLLTLVRLKLNGPRIEPIETEMTAQQSKAKTSNGHRLCFYVQLVQTKTNMNSNSTLTLTPTLTLTRNINSLTIFPLKVNTSPRLSSAVIIIISSTFINSARVTQYHNGAGWRQRLSSAHQICL